MDCVNLRLYVNHEHGFCQLNGCEASRRFVSNSLCEGGSHTELLFKNSVFKFSDCLCMYRCLDKEQLGSCAEGGKPAQSDLHRSSAGILGGRHVPNTLR